MDAVAVADVGFVDDASTVRADELFDALDALEGAAALHRWR